MSIPKRRNEETKKQRNKETKKQRNKETKKQRNKETKKQRTRNEPELCYIDVARYDSATKEQKSRQFFTPMSGGFLYHNHSSPSSTLLVSHLHEKLQVFNVDEGSRLMKWTSSRGGILNFIIYLFIYYFEFI